MLFKMRKPFYLIVLALLVVTLACGTSTSSDDATLGSEVVPQAPVEEIVPTVEPVEPEVSIPSSPFYLEEFDGGLDAWFYFSNLSDTDLEDNTEFYTEDGGLWFNIDMEDAYVYLINDAFEYTDVQIQVEAESLGRNNNYISLVCRYSDNLGWYEFNIAANGMVSIYRYDNNDGYIIIGEGGSTAIKQGKDTNVFTARCKGDALTLTINGQEWRTFHDKTLKKGYIGLSAGSMNVTPVTIVFNWMDITEP